MRKLTALVAATALVTTLSACTAAPRGCELPFDEGKASALVSAEGALGSQPDVSFPTPLIAAETEVSTLISGEGAQIREGQIVDLQLSLYLGASATKLTQSSYDAGQPIRRTAGDPEDFFGSIVECATVGDRIAAATTVEDVYGKDALLSLGLGNEETLIAVVDVQRAHLARANGADQLAVNGMPAVVTSPEGVPGVTIPNDAPPTELRIATTKAGSGAVVEAGDEVIMHILSLDWQTDEVVQSTWERRAAAVSRIVDLADDEDGLPSGLVEALTGQRVGSQVLVVVPPEFGFDSADLPSGVTEGDTLVFVIDILGIE